MAIYTRWGTRVKIITARKVPVWIERSGGVVKWHYTEPKRTSRKSSRERYELDLCPVWHATAMCDDDRPEYGTKGKMIRDGQEMDENEFRADDGIREMHAEFERLAEQIAA